MFLVFLHEGYSFIKLGSKGYAGSPRDNDGTGANPGASSSEAGGISREMIFLLIQ